VNSFEEAKRIADEVNNFPGRKKDIVGAEQCEGCGCGIISQVQDISMRAKRRHEGVRTLCDDCRNDEKKEKRRNKKKD